MSNWLGLKVGDFTIDGILGGSNFSWVYSGTHTTDGTICAFKVPVAADSPGRISDTGFYPSRALERITSGYAEVKPNTTTLLTQQCRLIETLNSPAFPELFELVDSDPICYARMELLHGKSLRTLIMQGQADLAIFRNFILQMQLLEVMPGFKCHGDLKPENLIVTADGIVRIIDPGFYGELLTTDGRRLSCAVTTPEYYPLINADDLMAAGFLFYEIATGSMVLDRFWTGSIDTANIGPKLKDKLNILETTGNYYLSAICDLRHPQDVQPALNSWQSNLILKSMRLQFLADGRVELVDGFSSFQEFGNALDELVAPTA